MLLSNKKLAAAFSMSLVLGAPAALVAQDVVVNTQGGVRILDGAASTSKIALTDFGSVDVSAAAKQRTFFIRNLDFDTTLNVETVEIVPPGEFTISDQRNFQTLSWNATDSFTVAFNPGSAGAKSATINFQTSDPDGTEAVFNFTVSGYGIDTTPEAAPNLKVLMPAPLKEKIGEESTLVSGQVTIENHGTADAEGALLQIYESRNEFHEATDTVVATIPVKGIPIGKSAKVRFKVTPSLAHGRLYFRALPEPQSPNDLEYSDNQIFREF